MKSKPSSKLIATFLSLVLAVVVLAGCRGNQAPAAYIDSIVPPEATQGETVTFTGHGTDADGSVVAYRWTSNLDGEIGTSASFNTSSLSMGNHTISFRVQDNSGAWSENATSSVTITEVEDTTPPVTPNLTSPANGATLPQPDEEWSFDWSDSSDAESGVAGYQLYVIHQGAVAPLVNVFITESDYSEILGIQISHEYLDNWIWKVRAQNNAGLWSPWSDTRTFSVEPKITGTSMISQTDEDDSAWFGVEPTYHYNVGHGQGFEVTEAGFFDQFQMYLTSNSSTSSGDIIVCDLRDASGNVLQSSSIHGFTAGHGGWQIFSFNLETYVTPGTYYCTCYVSNPIINHVYSCHCNSNDDSYPDGTHYFWYNVYGDAEDWSSWHHYPLDMKFKAIIKTGP